MHILEEQCGIKASPGTVLFFQIKTRNKKTFTFQTASSEDMIHIEILDEKKSNTPYNTSITKPKWEVYLAKEICYQQTSTHYANTLKMLATIDGLV